MPGSNQHSNARLRKLLDGLTQGVAIARAVVTAQDGDGAISLGKVMGDEPDEAAQGRTVQALLGSPGLASRAGHSDPDGSPFR